MTAATFAPSIPEPEFLRVAEAMTVLRLGRTKLYELIRSGRLPSYKDDGVRLIPTEAIQEYKALLKKEAENNR
jgi:excisionase family DNA binding protein